MPFGRDHLEDAGERRTKLQRDHAGARNHHLGGERPFEVDRRLQQRAMTEHPGRRALFDEVLDFGLGNARVLGGIAHRPVAPVERGDHASDPRQGRGERQHRHLERTDRAQQYVSEVGGPAAHQARRQLGEHRVEQRYEHGGVDTAPDRPGS